MDEKESGSPKLWLYVAAPFGLAAMLTAFWGYWQSLGSDFEQVEAPRTWIVELIRSLPSWVVLFVILCAYGLLVSLFAYGRAKKYYRLWQEASRVTQDEIRDGIGALRKITWFSHLFEEEEEDAASFMHHLGSQLWTNSVTRYSVERLLRDWNVHYGDNVGPLAYGILNAWVSVGFVRPISDDDISGSGTKYGLTEAGQAAVRQLGLARMSKKG